MWLYVSLQERNIQALGAVWTKSQYLNNWAYKISKNKTNLYSACREITEPGALWSQGQLLILALISHRGTMPPCYFCKADWHSGIPAQLTAMMDGAPAPAPPGCQLAQKPYIYMWNYHSVYLTKYIFTSPLLHKKTSTTSKAYFDFQICSSFFAQSRKPNHCTAASPLQGQILTRRLDSMLACKARCLTSSIAWDTREMKHLCQLQQCFSLSDSVAVLDDFEREMGATFP